MNTLSDDNIDKFQLLSQLKEIQTADYLGLPTGLIAHAILNTIDTVELVKIYVNGKSDDLWVMRNIIRRLPDSNQKEIIYEYVFNQLQSANYVNRLRLKKILETLLPYLEDIYKLEFFSYFYRSHYKIEFRAAIQYTPNIWTKEIQDILLLSYEKSKNPYVLQVLINNIDVDLLPGFAKQVWSVGFPRSFKQSLIERLKGMPYDAISFLQDIDPANFLTLAYYTKQKIDDKILMNCYKHIPERLKPFGIWSLGKLDKWKMIKKDIQKFIDQPLGTFEGFSDVILER